MQNPPNILAERETLGRLKKQKCLNPSVCETPRAARRGCYFRRKTSPKLDHSLVSPLRVFLGKQLTGHQGQALGFDMRRPGEVPGVLGWGVVLDIGTQAPPPLLLRIPSPRGALAR